MKTKLSTKSGIIMLLALVMILVLASCANREIVESCVSGHKYGFWGGLWHGIIAPIDFVIMLFNDKVTMYAQNNNGGWYALGFLMGSGGWGFFGGKGARRRRRRE